jgi:uncharacterized RDD family membrane protein YckC
MLKKQVNFNEIDLQNDDELFLSFGKRLLACFLDFIIIFILYIVNIFNIHFLESLSLHILLFIIIIVYKIVPELIYHQSFGKRIVGGFLTKNQFTPPSAMDIVKRNFLFIIYFALSFMVGLVDFSSGHKITAQIQSGDLYFNFTVLLTYTLVGIIFLYGISLFCALITVKRQSLHDLYGGTYFVFNKFR